MIEVKTLDDVIVNVTIPNSIDDNIQGVVDVWGTVKSKGTVNATHFAHFTTNTDFGNCNQLSKIL